MADLETPFISAYDTSVRRDLLQWAGSRSGTYVDGILQAQVPDAQRMRLLDAARTRESLMEMMGEDPSEGSPKAKEEKAPQVGMAGAFWNGLKRGAYELGAAGAGAGALYSHLRGATDLEKSRRAAADEYRAFAEAVPKVDERAFLEHPTKVLSPLWAAETIGHAAPTLATFIIPGAILPRLALGAGTTLAMTPAAIGRLVWLGQRLGPGLVWGTEELGSMYSESIAQGKDANEAATMALQAGAVGTALGAINLHSVINTQGGLVKRAFKGGGLMEIYNFLSQGAHGLIRGEDVVTILRDTINGMPEAALVGGALGVAMGTKGAPKAATEGAVAPSSEAPPAAPQTPSPAPAEPAMTMPRLAALLAGGKKVTGAHMAQAERLLREHPGASEADLVRLALGGLPEAEALGPRPEPYRAVYTDADGRAVPGMALSSREAMLAGKEGFPPSEAVLRATPPVEAPAPAPPRAVEGAGEPRTIEPARIVTPAEPPIAGEPAPPSMITSVAGLNIGDVIEYTSGFPPGRVVGRITGFAKSPIKGTTDVPMVQILEGEHVSQKMLIGKGPLPQSEALMGKKLPTEKPPEEVPRETPLATPAAPPPKAAPSEPRPGGRFVDDVQAGAHGEHGDPAEAELRAAAGQLASEIGAQGGRVGGEDLIDRVRGVSPRGIRAFPSPDAPSAEWKALPLYLKSNAPEAMHLDEIADALGTDVQTLAEDLKTKAGQRDPHITSAMVQALRRYAEHGLEKGPQGGKGIDQDALKEKILAILQERKGWDEKAQAAQAAEAAAEPPHGALDELTAFFDQQAAEGRLQEARTIEPAKIVTPGEPPIAGEPAPPLRTKGHEQVVTMPEFPVASRESPFKEGQKVLYDGADVTVVQSDPLAGRAEIAIPGKGHRWVPWEDIALAPRSVEFQPDVGKPIDVPAESVRPVPDGGVDPHLPGFAHVPGGPEGVFARALRSLQANEEFESARIEQKRGTRSHDVTQAAADAARKAKKVTLGQILAWEPGTIVNPEEARAAIDIALEAQRHAGILEREALRDGMDEDAASTARIVSVVALRNATAVASEYGRGLEAMKITGVPAGWQAVYEEMGVLPVAGGVDQIPEIVRRLTETAGGPRKLLEQMAMLPKEVQRRGLGSLWVRTGQAYLETFMAWIFSPLTAAKVVASGFVTAGRQIALTGVKEFGVRPVKRLLNELAPEYVGPAVTQAGATMNQVEALVASLTQAWSAIGKMHDGLSRLYRTEGLVKTEQRAGAVLREAMPNYAEATKNWKWQPKVTGEQFPELEGKGTVGEVAGRVLDIVGAVSRAPTLDLLSTAHGFSFTMHDYMASYAKAAEMAEGRGLEGPARSAEINRLLQERPPEVARAGMENGKYQTFLAGAEAEVGKTLQPFQNIWSRLLVAPVVGFPVRAALMAGETLPGIQHLIPKMRADWKAGGGAREMYLAKVAAGWSLFAIGTALTNAGIITGKRPKGVLGDVWDAQGKQEYSFYLGNTAISYARAFEPLGLVFGTVANFAQAARELVEDHGFWDEALVVMASVGHTVLDMPIMQGLSRWIEAMRSDDPNAMAKLIAQQVTPPPPMGGTLGIAAKMADPIRREAHTWSERVLQRLPGWSDSLKPHRNLITGEPLLHEGMFGPGTSSLLATHTMVDSPALKELERLRGAGLQRVLDHMYGRRPDEYVERQGARPAGVRLTDAQRDRWQVLMTQEVKPGGKNLEQAMTALVTSAAYQKQDDLEKTARIHAVWSNYFLVARERLLKEDEGLRAKVQGVLGEQAIRRLPTERQAPARGRMLSTLGR